MKSENLYSNIERCDPTSCISGKVMLLNRMTANIFRKYLRPFDVTDSQLSILFVLCKKGDLNQKDLASIVKLEKSSLNRNLKRLIAKEYVTRRDFPLMQITEKGKVALNHIVPEWEKAMQEIRGYLADDGESALDLILEKLLAENQ